MSDERHARLGHELFHEAGRRCDAAGIGTVGDIFEVLAFASALAIASGHRADDDGPFTVDDWAMFSEEFEMRLGRVVCAFGVVTHELLDAVNQLDRERQAAEREALQ